MASNGGITTTTTPSPMPMSNNNTAPQQQQHTSLFVGNLDGRVYRELLSNIFSLAGRVTQCHVVYDKTTGQSSGFGFVHYEDHATAEAAMDKFRGRSIYGKLMTIDWARASNNNNSSTDRSNSQLSNNNNSQNVPNQNNSAGSNTNNTGGTPGNYCLFVGNLSSNVTDDQLVTAFSEFGSCTSAKCAKDPVTYDTQGFAFVTFRNRDDAVSAMQAMNGQLLNNRPLRVDWAKGKTSGNGQVNNNEYSHHQNDNMKEKDVLTFDAVMSQTSVNNITAYISGLPQGTTENEIRDAFAQFGMIRDIRIPDSAKSNTSGGGEQKTMYAFVRYVDHVTAAKAIFQSQNGATNVSGKTVNVHWGREVVRRHHNNNNNMMQQQQQQGMQQQMQQLKYSHYHQQQQGNNFHHHSNPNLNYYQQQQQQQQQYQQQFHQQAQNAYAYHQQNTQQPQQQTPQQQQQPSRNNMYQTYNRTAGPGPMHQPAATAQHRFRPY